MDWTDMVSSVFLVQVLSASVTMATPLVLAAIGEVFAERSGVFNLGIDGFMLLGGFSAFAVAFFTGNLWAGLAASLIVGAVVGLLFAFMTVGVRADQVVTGLGILILASGAATYMDRILFSTTYLVIPQIAPFQIAPIPVLSNIPILGPVLFQHTVITYFMLVLVVIAVIVLYRTPIGLRIHAVGENPAAADSIGVNVMGIRYFCVVLGGMLAGLGGACFSLGELGFYTDGMVGGRGFIALALVVFGGWNPILVFLGGLLFGAVDAMQIRLQFLAAAIPSQFLIMLPYLLTIIALLVGRRRSAPAALTLPYFRDQPN